MERYRGLESRLRAIRQERQGRESAEEDAILDEMEWAWMALTEDEKNTLNREGV
jgi:hypothetical protein